MRVHCFGEAGLPTVVLIHGLATTWEQSFGEIIPKLSDRYHVIAVSLSGHDPTDPDDFGSRKSEAHQMAHYLRRERAGSVHGVFGASLGAAVAVELSCSGLVRIDSLVLDGLVRLPIDRCTRRLAGPAARLGRAVVAGRGGWLLRWAGVTPERIAGLVYGGVSQTSLRNGFVEGFGVYAMLRDVPVQHDVRVACWYGEKEARLVGGGIRELRRHFPRLTERVFPGYGHGEILKHPQQFVAEFAAFLEHAAPAASV